MDKAKCDAQKEKNRDKINSNRRQMIDELEAFEENLLVNICCLQTSLTLISKLLVDDIHEFAVHLEKIRMRNLSTSEFTVCDMCAK